MKESWQPVPGYEGLYQVSDLGRVRSLDRTVWRQRLGKAMQWTLQGRLLKTKWVGRAKYVGVSLSKNGQVATRTVHSLVALAFIGPRPEGMEVNHKDCDKQNNALNNLEYLTHGENQRHAAQRGRMSNDNWTRRERNALGQFSSSKACPQPHAVA